MVKRTREELKARQSRKKRAYQQKASTLARISQGGVPGGGIFSIPRGFPNQSPEVKSVQAGAVLTPTTGTGGQWFCIENTMVASITQGVGHVHRSGRQIRIVGVQYRFDVTNFVSGLDTIPGPYTIDFMWDKKPTAVAPTNTEVYTGTSALSLPNPVNETRFVYQKRIEKIPNSAYSRVSGLFKCNKLVSYSDNSGTIGGCEQNNFLVWLGQTSQMSTTPAVVTGVMRVCFIDA